MSTGTEQASTAISTAETMREAVFGIEDGLVSTLGVITGIAVGSGSSYIVILSGLVVIAVEALSMTAGSFLSSHTARGVEERILRDTLAAFPPDKAGRVERLAALFMHEGMAAPLARQSARDAVARGTWKREVALHALGLGSTDGLRPGRNAAYMGLAYILGGALTVAPYFFLGITPSIVVSVALTVGALFGVGAIKTKFTTGSWWREGVEMVVVSLGAVVVGYGVGALVHAWFGVSVV